MRKVLIVCFIVSGLCCLNKMSLFADNGDSICQNKETLSFNGNNNDLEFRTSIKELREKIKELEQHCDNQYSDYLTHINTVMIWPSIIITALIAIFGACVPLLINYINNKSFKQRINDINGKLEKFNVDYDSSQKVLNELQILVNKHETNSIKQRIKQITQEYEKRRRLSLYIPINVSNKKIIEIVLNKQSASKKIEMLNYIIDNECNDELAFIMRGVYYLDINKYTNSRDDFIKAIELAPNDAALYNNLGVVYNALEDYDEAIKAFTTAIDLDENFVLAYHNRAYSNRYKKNYKEALKDCKKAINLNVTFADAYNTLASICRDKGEYDNALINIKISVGLDYENSWAYNGWALVLIAQEKYYEAYGKSLLSLNYDNRPELYDTCAEALMGNKDYIEAIKMCKKGLEQNPDNRMKSILEQKIEECNNNIDLE